jgi:hypothetical protein
VDPGEPHGTEVRHRRAAEIALKACLEGADADPGERGELDDGERMLRMVLDGLDGAPDRC